MSDWMQTRVAWMCSERPFRLHVGGFLGGALQASPGAAAIERALAERSTCAPVNRMDEASHV
jgi:hypothetical protein